MGGGSKTIESPYDDKWIRDWTGKAEETEKKYGFRIDRLIDQNRNRLRENIRQDKSLENLTGLSDKAALDIEGLTSTSNIQAANLEELYGFDKARQQEIADLEDLIRNQKRAGIGDIKGLDNRLKDLMRRYQSNKSDLAKFKGNIRGEIGTVKKGLKGELDARIAGLGLNKYMEKSTFESRMTDRLNETRKLLKDQWGEDIKSLDLGSVRRDIKRAEGDLGKLSTKFAGLSSDVRWIKDLDLGKIDDKILKQGKNIRAEFEGDLTNLQNVLESGRGESLAKLERKLGKDRAADLLRLKQDIEDGTASKIERIAGNLRTEYGKEIFDLSDTFDERFDTLQTDIGDDIASLFSQQGTLRGDLERGLATFTSGLGTTSQQLEALRDSFGKSQTKFETDLGNVKSALELEIGDLSESLTKGLGDIQTDYLDKILGTERVGVEAREGLRADLTGALGLEAEARQSGLASEATARQAGLATEAAAREEGLAQAASERQALAGTLRGEAASALQDVYQSREQAIEDLSGRFGENLREQEERLNRTIFASQRDVDDQISKLGSMMNYRMLGDSAGGVKMRRSKAYTSGAVNTGTGQLSRSMKLKTLNI